MPIAYWCILIAGVFPYAVVALAKRSGDGYDNADPRNVENLLEGSRYRAHMAHLNSFEAFGFFAVSVIVAGQLNGGPHPVLDLLAVLWVMSRILYVAAYLGDRPTLRTSVWSVGFLISLAIFTFSLWSPLVLR